MGSAKEPNQGSSRPAPVWLRISLILAIALILRLGFAWDYQRGKPRHALGTIPFLFEPGNIAYSLAAGKGFSSPFHTETGPTAWMPPVYPLVIAGIFRLFGLYTYPAFVAAVLLNIACSTLTCLPLFFAGRRIGGAGLGAVAAWLWAIFPNAILIPFETLREASLSALLAITLLWATLRVAESKRLLHWCWYGVLWGLALMTNTTLAGLLPFLIGWAAWRGNRKIRLPIDRPALAVVIAMLCCVPWATRNYIVFDSFVPLRTGLGLQLWMGNNEHAEDRTQGALHPISSQVERARYVEIGEIAYMQEKLGEAIRFMVDHPRIEVRWTATRFITFWSGGSARPVADFLRVSSVRFRFVLLFNVLAAVAAGLGLIALWRRNRECAFPCAVFLVVLPCVSYLTIASARYRHPIDPVVLLLAAVGVQAVSFRRRGALQRKLAGDRRS